MELVSGPPGMALTGNSLDWAYVGSQRDVMYEVELRGYYDPGFAYDYTVKGAVMQWGVPSNLQYFCQGSTYTYRPSIASSLSSSTPVTYAVESLTPDLTISSDGTITYTGTVADTFIISLSIDGLVYKSQFELKEITTCAALGLSIPTQVYAAPYTISKTKLSVSDSDYSEGHIWTVTGLTATMTVNYSVDPVEIWWVPETGEPSAVVTVQVRNVGGISATGSISFSVNSPPVLTPVPDMSLSLLCSIQYQVTGTDPDNDSLTFSISPSSLTLSSGYLTAPSPPPPGTYSLDVTVNLT